MCLFNRQDQIGCEAGSSRGVRCGARAAADYPGSGETSARHGPREGGAGSGQRCPPRQQWDEPGPVNRNRRTELASLRCIQRLKSIRLPTGVLLIRFAIPLLLGLLVLGCETGVESLVAEEIAAGGGSVPDLETTEAASHPVAVTLTRIGDSMHVSVIPASARERLSELVALDVELTGKLSQYEAAVASRPVGIITATVSDLGDDGTSPVRIRVTRADADR